jgi:hypothetical protein
MSAQPPIGSSDLLTGQALARFIDASSWPRSFDVLEEQKELLLTNRALVLMHHTISDLYERNQDEDARIFEELAWIISTSRWFGIAVIRARFIPEQAENT